MKVYLICDKNKGEDRLSPDDNLRDLGISFCYAFLTKKEATEYFKYECLSKKDFEIVPFEPVQKQCFLDIII